MRNFLFKLWHSPFPIFLIIIIGSFLRFYELGSNPPSLDWDEASLGYNAFSLLRTGKDEFGRPWPVSIRSFEDYKPALYTYLTIPSVSIFGLNEFSTRLPSALSGIMTVIITYFLIKRLLALEKAEEKNSRFIALSTAGLLAISPWHIQFSRVAFEANVALGCMVLGFYLLTRAIRSSIYLPFSALVLSLSFYAYHSPRLLVPLMTVCWLFIFRKEFLQKKIWLLISAVLSILILLPFLKEASSTGRARFSSVTVLNPEGRLDQAIKDWEMDESVGDFSGKLWHNRRIIYALEIIKGYLDHYNFDFLFLFGDAPGRHHANDIGMLYLIEFPIIISGIIYLLKNRNRSTNIIFVWFFLSPVASALTTGTPHAVRALFILPLYQLFAAFGLYYIFIKLNKTGKFQTIILLFIFCGYLINFTYYFDMYFRHTPVESAHDWQYGYKEAVYEAAKWENATEQIVVTYSYDQPHIYVLFYRQIDPAWYQIQPKGENVMRFERKFGKYTFRPINWEQDKNLKNTLLIGTPGEIPENSKEIISEILFPNGQIAFRIVKL